MVAWWIERDEGKIAMGIHLLPSWYGPDLVAHHMAERDGVADKLDKLHLHKIDLADEVYIINWNGYIGSSTKREIKHAKARGLPIRWLWPAKEALLESADNTCKVAPYHPEYRDRILALDEAAKKR